MRHFHRAKRDGNHAAIVAALKARGCTVLDLASLGGGAPDILVAVSGRCWLMEIKNPDGRDRVSANQVEWHRTWKGPKVVVVRSVQEALEATGAVTVIPSPNVPVRAEGRGGQATR